MDRYPAFSLKLADNSGWLISGADPEAARIVSGLAQAMSLAPVAGSAEPRPGKYRRLQVVVDRGVQRSTAGLNSSGTFLCLLPEPINTAMFVIGMSQVASVIARAEQARSGLLIHGALARLPGQAPAGVLLAGSSGVGKSTAGRRLPPPWRSLSDDAALVVRDHRGIYHAHPWPTWSQFYDTPESNPGPGGSWEVQKSVSLRALFFLGQAVEDRVEPLSSAAAVPLLLETVEHVSQCMKQDLVPNQLRTLYQQRLTAAEELLRVIPAHTLHVSLTGSFWQEIEKTVTSPVRNQPPKLDHNYGSASADKTASEKLCPQRLWVKDNILPVLYTGPSMNPTLCHPDLLEVVPYSDDRPVRPGDVIYYLPPDRDQRVVHRVIRITADGIHTRGDNNPAADPYRLQPVDIIGQVSAAWRYEKRRKIAGGVYGLLHHHGAGLRRKINRALSPVLHGVYHFLSTKTPIYRLLPYSLRPKVYEFKYRSLPSKLKLMVKKRVIGHYDYRGNIWCIERPWRLFVNTAALPVILTRPLTEAMTIEDLNNLYAVVPGTAAAKEKTR